ncbi:membrane protein [Arthrobacter phage Hirko]|nr:membrane protein [Arthrobacter phage Hirko]
MDTATVTALAALGPVALWLMAVGFFSPLVIAVIQQSRWSARRQSVVAFLFYVVVAAVTAWLNGIFTTVGIVTAVLVVFVIASTAYKALWKPAGVAPAIESATSPVPAADGKHEAGADVPEYTDPGPLG